MQDTRQQILEILKRHNEVTVQELSQKLGLTSVTVRHHLEILRSEGYITEPEIRRSSRPGRPRYVYRLTSTAADLFPNNYSGLADALLDAIEEHVAPEERESLLDKAATRMIASVGELPEQPDERMNRILTFLNQQGFVARWDKEADGRYMIYISSCPYHYVAQKHNETCKIDEMIIKKLTNAKLTQVQGSAHQGAICVYEVKWAQN